MLEQALQSETSDHSRSTPQPGQFLVNDAQLKIF